MDSGHVLPEDLFSFIVGKARPKSQVKDIPTMSRNDIFLSRLSMAILRHLRYNYIGLKYDYASLCKQ